MGLSIFQDPIRLFSFVVALVLGFTVHEFCHAFVAYRLGDETSRSQGRLSLNPLVHLDPLGTIFLLIGGIGWAKPVPVNPFALRNGAKFGMLFVSIAGPFSNFLLAWLFALIYNLNLVSPEDFGGRGAGILTLNESIIYLNLLLCAFNLLPLPPLDGFKVALGILPEALSNPLAKLEQFGPGILMGLILLDMYLHIGILSRVLSPLMTFLLRIVIGQ